MGNFQNVLKLLRTAKGLTQEQLAKKLKLSRSTVGMYENGSREPDYETLEQIADFFNVDIDYLLGRTNKTTIIPESYLGYDNNMSEKDFKKIFSKQLNYYMNVTGKTQSDIINELGFNKSAVSTWCNGTRLPRMDKVDALAKYFGVNRSDLIEDKNHITTPTYYLDEDSRETAQFLFENPDYKVLFDASRKVRPEDIGFVKELLDRFAKED